MTSEYTWGGFFGRDEESDEVVGGEDNTDLSHNDISVDMGDGDDQDVSEPNEGSVEASVEPVEVAQETVSVESEVEEKPVSDDLVRRMASTLKRSRHNEITLEEAVELLKSNPEMMEKYKNLRTWHKT